MPFPRASFAAPTSPAPAEEEAGGTRTGRSTANVAARRVAVLLPLPLAGAYDYAVPAGLAVAPGSFVAAPLGPRLVAGVVWGPGSDEVDPARLKPIARVLDAPPLPEELRRLVDWVAGYTLSPPGAVLRMAMSVAAALEPPRPIQAVAISAAGRAVLAGSDAPNPAAPPPLAGEGGGGTEATGASREPSSPASGGGADSTRRGLTPTRRRVLALAAEGPARPAAELARAAGCGTGVTRALGDLGLLETVLLPARRNRPVPDWRRAGPTFSPEQAAAGRSLAASVRAGGFSVTLLDGVTGSGKTEVYFEAVAAALERGRQVLILLPEIALGAQFLGRFARRFGAKPAEWHSDLGQAERRQTWREIAEGSAPVVVGARSALFLPFPDLGLVIVDEEHESSYKQEEVVIYHARDMAVVRGSIARIPVVLVSATPSLETVVNVQQQRYRRVHLPARHGGAPLPAIEVIDLRRERLERQRFLAAPLARAVEETVAGGEQAMLFLNRRGYAPLTLCRACGHRLQCPNCTAWLVEHRLTGELQCHHCGHAERIPPLCPECGEPGTLAACGPGVERLAEEVAARFPAARLAVMASDTLAGPHAAAELVDRVQRHEIDVLIGTQVVAKGHHFPMLTLVGVVDADLGLAGGDLRAAERTYQLLHQVAGRAGRAERPGRVMLQTFMPEHPVIAALVRGDRDGFLAAESEERLRYGMPPFGRLAALIVSAPDDEEANFVAASFARAAPHMPGVDVLGPAPAPLAVLRRRHRRRFLLKAQRGVNVQAVVRDWLGRVKVPSTTRVYLDIDPYSFL